jgi:hypothetical protein
VWQRYQYPQHDPIRLPVLRIAMVCPIELPFEMSIPKAVSFVFGATLFVAPYIAIGWIGYKASDNTSQSFWIWAGIAMSFRFGFFIVETALQNVHWFLFDRSIQIDNVKMNLAKARMPKPDTHDYFSYIGRLQHSAPTEEIRAIANHEMLVMSAVEPHQGALARVRYHNTLNAALQQYGQTFG